MTTIMGDVKGDTRSLDYSSYSVQGPILWDRAVGFIWNNPSACPLSLQGTEKLALDNLS